MLEAEYQSGLKRLRDDWGRMYIDDSRNRGGFVVAANDPTTGILVGFRAPLIAEIINRALSGKYDQR